MIGNCFRRSDREAVRPGFGHASSAQGRIGVGLALVAGAAVAAALALTATSPAAKADTVDLPDFPVGTGPGTDQVQLGIQPLFSETTFDQQGTYTDLLGVAVNTNNLTSPLQYVSYAYPATNPSFAAEGITDPNTVVATLPDGLAGGSTFGATATTGGWYDL